MRRLAPFSHYYFGEKKGSDYLTMVGLTCDSSKLKGDLVRASWGLSTSLFACLQDSADSDCDTRLSETVLQEYLLSIFPTKSKYEKYKEIPI